MQQTRLKSLHQQTYLELGREEIWEGLPEEAREEAHRLLCELLCHVFKEEQLRGDRHER